MIFDTFENACLYGPVADRLRRGLEVLSEPGIGDKADGRYDVDGDNIYYVVQRYTTKPFDQGKIEAHRQYIDIQFITSGIETLGYTDLAGLEVADEYDAEKDIVFYGQGENVDKLTLRPGVFCVLFPQDGHMPCREFDGPGEVCKVVVKVKIGCGCSCDKGCGA